MTTEVELQYIEVLWSRFKEQLTERPSLRLEDFANEHPELKDEILRVFPVMRDLESLTAPTKEEIPANIGRYPIVRRIGTGGMGVVFEAQCNALRERIAIKVVASDRLDPKSLQRFEREARTVAALHHSNIVPIYEFGQENDQHFYTMRLVDGPNLAEVMRLAELSERDDFSEFESTDVRAYQLLAKIAGNWEFIAELGAQAASALKYAHAKDVMHRDIKPANLLVDNTDKLWVTDFGLAKRVLPDNELTSIFQAVGTPRYMAPEQAKGLADPRSDVYSLGLTLHELVTLQAGDGPYRHKGAETPPSPRAINPKIPVALDQIIVKAIQANPADRYRTAGELALDLEQCVAAMRRSEPQVESPKRGGKRKWLGLVAMLMIGFGAFLFARPSPKNVPLDISILEGETTIGELTEWLTNNEMQYLAPGLKLEGQDSECFVYDHETGQLRLIQPANYEVPLDHDMDNVYQVLLGKKELRVRVQNYNEPPTVDRFVFASDGQTIRLGGQQLREAWMLDVKDDQNEMFSGLHFAITGGADQSLVKMTPQGVFAFDPRLAKGQILDENEDGVLEVELSVIDSSSAWLLRLEQREEGRIAMLRERIVAGARLESHELAEDCLIRRDVIDIACADGRNIYHIHPSGNDEVSLFRSKLNESGTLEPELLSRHCGLPTGTIGFATSDGTNFVAVARKQGDVSSTKLLACSLQQDGTFAVQTISQSSGLPIATTGLAWLDGKRFHHIRKLAVGHSQLYFSFLGERFANMALDNTRTQYDTVVRGQAAWVEMAEDAQKISKAIRFDTNMH